MEIMPSNAVAWSHLMADRWTHPDAIAVDLTAGNGKDSLFLAKRVKKLIAMDIQQTAIDATRRLLATEGCQNVEIVCDSHEKIDQYVDIPVVDLLLMNLGYLPKGDKEYTTVWETTQRTINLVLHHMKKGALLSICVYPGHVEGARESEGLKKYCRSLPQKDYKVLSIQFPNQENDPPYWIGIERC